MDIPILAGEMTTVELPGFSRTLGSGMLFRTSERSVYWDDCAEKLFVEALAPVGEGAQQLLVLPVETGIRLPTIGVLANQSDFRISTNAAAVTPRISLDSTQPVGAFVQGPDLSFDSPMANETTEIKVFLELARPMEAGDTISLRLPGFKAISSSLHFSDLHDTVIWNWSPTSELLSITLRDPLSHNITARLPAGWLRLPVHGVPQSGMGYSVQVSSVFMPLDPSPLNSIQAVGSFSDTLRTFLLPQKAGTPAQLAIHLTPSMDITAGESIFFKLGGFTVPDGSEPVVPGDSLSVNPPGSLESVGWNSNSTMLRLIFGTDLSAGTPFSMVVDGLGLKIPADGIRRVEDFEVSTDTESGPVVGMHLTTLAPIGALRSPTLAYGNPRAGLLTDITISFTPMMPFTEGYPRAIVASRIPGSRWAAVSVERRASGGFFVGCVGPGYQPPGTRHWATC